ncbi:GGDEF domain-containing protein [Herbaspirillum sp. HC18]|nr:GGDEF domain-containing protein [Herbaspirillum sp. HC18]
MTLLREMCNGPLSPSRFNNGRIFTEHLPVQHVSSAFSQMALLPGCFMLSRSLQNPYTPKLGWGGRTSIGLLSLISIAGIATIDILIGADYSLSLLYLVPVGVSTWYVDKRVGVTFSVISTLAIELEHLFPADPIHYGPVLWQGLVHLCFMLTFVFLLHRIRMALEQQEMFASTDPLTGVLNRRAFLERLNYILRLAGRERIPLSLAYIDLDNFKQINDQYGHDAGDRLLIHVARTFTGNIRSSDVVSRLGGDEFAILLPDTNASQAQHFVSKLWHSLSSSPDAEKAPVNCSVGCITFITPPPDAASALQAGDALMYEVKRSGKNKISFGEWR